MIEVVKYHGTGNDFVVVDADEEVPDRRRFARAICDRTDGIAHADSARTGADGVLFCSLEPETTPPRIVMTLVQPDGSVAAMCGNGARCAAAWAARKTGAAEFMIDTPAGTYPASVGDDGVRVGMGRPSFDPAYVPIEGTEPMIQEGLAGLDVTAVNTGVPHAVAFVADVAAVDLAAVGPKVRYADIFPRGTNLTVASERSDGGFDQRTYERGVEAETDSCGTGAVAIGAVAHRLGSVEDGVGVPIHPPGGRLVVTVDRDGATLEGPVEREFDDRVDPDRPRAADPAGD